MAQLTNAGLPSSGGVQRYTPMGAYVSTDSFQNVQSTAGIRDVALGGAEFAYDHSQKDFSFAPEYRNEREKSAPHQWSVLNTPTETFARILESFIGGSDVAGAAGSTGQSFRGNVAQAISTYETNAKIIHGELAAVGSNLSIRL